MSAFERKADMTIYGYLLSRSLLGVKRTLPFAPHMSDPKRTSSRSTVYGLRKKDRLAAVFLNGLAENYCVLMRIEAGWPDSLKRFTGVIFVPSTIRIERSSSR
jgi:hypothetical protein